MDFVCASCGNRIHVLTGAATPPVCDCGGTTWRRCDAPAALVGVGYPDGFDVLVESADALNQPNSPRIPKPAA